MFLLVTLVTIETFDQGKVSPNQNRAAGQVAQLEAAIDVSAVVIFILQQMTDGLIVRLRRYISKTDPSPASFQMYRCRIVWGGCRFDLIPSILWLTASGEHQISTPPRTKVDGVPNQSQESWFFGTVV